MMDETTRQAIASLPEEAFTNAGVPKVDALEAALAEAFPDDPRKQLTAQDRDDYWEAFQLLEGAEASEEEPTHRTVTITKAQSNPVKIIVNGRTLAVLQIGEAKNIDTAAYEHLCQAPDIEFEEG